MATVDATMPMLSFDDAMYGEAVRSGGHSSASAKDELESIVSDIVAKPTALDTSDRLYHDLNIAGDDATRLLDEIHQRFGVRFAGFRFDSYFPNDTDAFVEFWLAKIGLRGKWKELTIDHMLKVIDRGAWFEPDDVQVA